VNTKTTNPQTMSDLINLNQHIAAVRQILEYHLTSPESQIAPKKFTYISQLPPHGALTQLGTGLKIPINCPGIKTATASKHILTQGSKVLRLGGDNNFCFEVRGQKR
jgi:hypothetical protein